MEALPKLTQSQKNVISVLRTGNRELSVGAIAQKTSMNDERVRLVLEELAENKLIEVVRAGRGRILRAVLLQVGADAWSTAVTQGERPVNVQNDLAELKTAVEELQKTFAELDSDGTKHISISKERLDAITNLIPKGLAAVTWLSNYIHHP